MSTPDDLISAAERWCEDRSLPSAQLAVMADGEVIVDATVGRAEPGDRFLAWSCTKAVVAGVIWQLVGEGLVHYDEPVATYVPQFATNDKHTVTVEHVLLHTGGFPTAPLGPTRWATPEGRREAFARWRLNWEPGSRYEYHQLAGGWTLAAIIENVDGCDYRASVRRRITEPIGMTTFELGVPPERQHDITPVEVVGASAIDADWIAAGWPVLPPPEVAPHAALLMNTPAALEVGIPGGGGVGRAVDLARFSQAVLHDDGSLWDPDVLRDATSTIRNVFPDLSRWEEPANRTRGLVVRGDDEPYASLRHHFGPSTSPATFGHDGAGGQISWADPRSGLSFCFLTSGYDANRVAELRRNQELSALAGRLSP